MKTEESIRRTEDKVVCHQIFLQTREMMHFWKSSHGWAPVDAANLLSKSALEWQVSLSESLRRWVGCTTDGDLILAWANLGALVEGQLKLFLSVYYSDYARDLDAIRDRKQNLIDPDVCTL